MILMNEKLEEKLKEAAKNGRISCSLARRIAAELDVPVRQVGEAANNLKIKITSCELGCF
ncbi:MAG TPA: hypothetical protein GXZ50_08480 [Clostridia bacterium]|nr:hypothetical protein [Clostridia bacterium]